MLAVCSSDGHTKSFFPPVLPSIFNWTVTGFVQRTKTNGSGPGQFRDVVSRRRVNLKAESQVVRILMCVRTRKREREKERKKMKWKIVEKDKSSNIYFYPTLLWIWTLYIYVHTPQQCFDTFECFNRPSRLII